MRIKRESMIWGWVVMGDNFGLAKSDMWKNVRLVAG